MAVLVFEITGLKSGIPPQLLCACFKGQIYTGGMLARSCIPDNPETMTAVTVDAKGNPDPESVRRCIERTLDGASGVTYDGCRYVETPQ